MQWQPVQGREVTGKDNSIVSVPISMILNSPQTLKSNEEHLRRATIEHYNCGPLCQDPSAHKEHIQSQQPAFPRSCSALMEAHYSFDFAQQVHLPADPFQPGPLYFLTPRKCALFGVSCEAIPSHVKMMNDHNSSYNNNVKFYCNLYTFKVNYLIDEGVVSGKGANTVISFLHHFLHHHRLKETISST